MKSQILAMVGILAIVFIAGCTTTGNITSDTEKILYSECDSCCPEEKAMMDIELLEWGEYVGNFNRIYFSVVVYNYGYHEAKDVEVACELYNDKDSKYPEIIATDRIGNIASTSMKEREFHFNREDIFIDDDAVIKCKIVSCETCEILKDRISD